MFVCGKGDAKFSRYMKRISVGQYKYLFKNLGLLTLSSFATKLLSFFLVPLYTNVLTTTEYGTYDLFSTTIGVLLPILTLDIQESVMRFALDRKYDREVIVTVAIKYFFISNGVVLIGLLLNYLLVLNSLFKEYGLFFFLMFFSQSLSGIVIAYIRGNDKISDLSVSSVIASIGTICLNILFLIVFKLGLVGYFLSNIIGPVLQSLYLIIKSRMLCSWSPSKKYDCETKEMLGYCRPMIANSIAWWVNNASDKYVVVFFCGLAENGIYSVASKIPSILNIFQTIFNQAWTLSAVRDFDSEDSSGFFSNTYKVYNSLVVIVCSAIIVADKLLARLLYAKDFFAAWKYVPWLTIAIVFGALSGYLGGFFSAVKNSKIFAQSTIVGAVFNIILNMILTPQIGALGAAIATTVSYVLVWGIRLVHSRRYIKLNINLPRDICSYILLCAQAVLLLIFDSSVVYIIEISLFIAIVLIYFKELLILFKKILSLKNEID